jgi:CheY-like chemotaxis protein
MSIENIHNLPILVVDDNPMASKLVALSLKRLGYQNVQTINLGETVLEFVRKNRPEVILLDINMPKCDGVELAKQLKEICDCAIVFSTGRMDAPTVARAMQVDGALYLLKPYSPAQLQAALQRARGLMKRYVPSASGMGGSAGVSNAEAFDLLIQ